MSRRIFAAVGVDSEVCPALFCAATRDCVLVSRVCVN
jgi:hypothetical protein